MICTTCGNQMTVDVMRTKNIHGYAQHPICDECYNSPHHRKKMDETTENIPPRIIRDRKGGIVDE